MPDKPRWFSLKTIFWGSYDLANTIFSMAVITLFLPQWIIDDLGLPDMAYAVALSLSMLLVGLTTPYLGQRSDERGDHLSPLRRLTMLSVVSTGLMGVATLLGLPPVWSGIVVLLLFIPANYGFQAAQVFYNSLLPQVSTERTRGKVSGLGVAMGYLGSIIAFVAIFPFTQGTVIAGYAGRTAAFIPTAIFFGLLSIPCLFFIKDKSKPKPRPREGVWKRYLHVLKETGNYPGLRRYLLAAFLFLEAIHTVIAWMAVYIQKVLNVPDLNKIPIFLAGTAASIIGGLTWGFITDRFGAKRSLVVILIGWLVTLTVGALSNSIEVFYGVAVFIGFFLAGVWTTIRPMLLTLVPAETAGEFFGILALAGKAAAVIGPLLWGAITLIFSSIEPWNYRLALLTMGVLILAGLLIFLGVGKTRQRG